MATDCKGTLEELERFLDQELPEGKFAEVMGHLRTCPDCQGVFDFHGELEAGGGSVVGNGVLAVGVELLPDDAGAVAVGAGSGAVGSVGAAVTSADGLEPGVGLSSASAGVAMGLAGASLCTGLGVGTELDLRGGGACCDGGRSKETLMARPSSSSSSKNAILCSCSFSQCNTSRCASRVSSSMTTTSDQRREGRPGGRSDAEEASISLV